MNPVPNNVPVVNNNKVVPNQNDAINDKNGIKPAEKDLQGRKVSHVKGENTEKKESKSFLKTLANIVSYIPRIMAALFKGKSKKEIKKAVKEPVKENTKTFASALADKSPKVQHHVLMTEPMLAIQEPVKRPVYVHKKEAATEAKNNNHVNHEPITKEELIMQQQAILDDINENMYKKEFIMQQQAMLDNIHKNIQKKEPAPVKRPVYIDVPKKEPATVVKKDHSVKDKPITKKELQMQQVILDNIHKNNHKMHKNNHKRS